MLCSRGEQGWQKIISNKANSYGNASLDCAPWLCLMTTANVLVICMLPYASACFKLPVTADPLSSSFAACHYSECSNQPEAESEIESKQEPERERKRGEPCFPLFSLISLKATAATSLSTMKKVNATINRAQSVHMCVRL